VAGARKPIHPYLSRIKLTPQAYLQLCPVFFFCQGLPVLAAPIAACLAQHLAVLAHQTDIIQPQRRHHSHFNHLKSM